ncbi:MAG: hypothetical protein HXY22_08435 [Alphaproteobacteria bacterium]|nr:hypothetical protein [Alphaproteobacteria bacterium]
MIGRYVTAITSSRPLFRRGKFRISDFETGFMITSILPIFSPDRTAHWIFAALIPETVRLPIR